MKIGKKLCSDFLYFCILTEHALGITKRNVHAKFQENRPKNVEDELKNRQKIGENRLKNHVSIFGIFWLTNLTEVFMKDTFVQNFKKIG